MDATVESIQAHADVGKEKTNMPTTCGQCGIVYWQHNGMRHLFVPRIASVLVLLLALTVGCQKKPDSPPPPPDTANVTGTWTGPFTYTYPVVGGPVTNVTVNGNLSMMLHQDGLGITGTYTDSTGGAGNVNGSIQNHTFTGSLAFTPAGLGVNINLVNTTMDAQIASGATSGHGTFTKSAAPAVTSFGSF